MAQNETSIHKTVQDRYGAIARASGDPELTLTTATTCCGDSTTAAADCSCATDLYDPELLAGLPVDVTGLSLGCGDPVTIAALQPGETVLDLGSGGGIDCFLAARQVGPGGYIIGVDMTPDMLAKANANKATTGLTNVEFREGQIEALPVDGNTVDVIMSNCVINLSPDKTAVFQEAYRVLKPGGRLAISDVVTEGDFSEEMRAQVDRWAECVTGAIDVEEYLAMMKDAGFGEITVVDKVQADSIIPRQEGMPRIFSARITAYKPA